MAGRTRKAIARRARSEAATRGWETRRKRARAKERERKLRFKARSEATKRGAQTRKSNKLLAAFHAEQKRSLRVKMRELKARMRAGLSQMKHEVETGRGIKPWLGTKASYEEYRAAKDAARAELPIEQWQHILEALQKSMALDDVGWNIRQS